LPNVINGTIGNDTLNGGPGNDAIYGLEGNDWLLGGTGLDEQGNDLLDGGPGDDRLDGYGGNDTLTGGVGTDLLVGYEGADTYRDTAVGLNGDTILDFGPGDHIQITDLPLPNANLQINFHRIGPITGGSISYAGGSVSVVASRAAVRPIGSTGLEVIWQAPAHNDFNGDGRSDVMWRNDSGYLTQWLGTSSGSFASNQANAGASDVDNNWQIAATGDFNKDGLFDLLWRHSNGTVTSWLGTDSGGFRSNSDNHLEWVDPSWHVVATGAFTGIGYGYDDILWRNDDGTVRLERSAGDHFVPWPSADNSALNNNWQIVGTGDFNGDGIDDILWRGPNGYVTEWLGSLMGEFVSNEANAGTDIADSSWQIAGIGDFNGDAIADVLWRSAGGYVTEWLGTPTGALISNQEIAGTGIAGVEWHVVSIGDFNGDVIDDILWRNDGGYITEWLGTASGAFTSNQESAGTGIASTEWHLQDLFT